MTQETTDNFSHSVTNIQFKRKFWFEVDYQMLEHLHQNASFSKINIMIRKSFSLLYQLDRKFSITGTRAIFALRAHIDGDDRK